jgi:hypothetical protein
MNTEEKQYLYKEKISGGKTDIEASQEITDLIKAQKLFRKMKIEMKSLNNHISKLEKEREKFKEKAKDEKNKRLLEKLKNQKDVPQVQFEKHYNGKQPTLIHASRVINFTEVGKEYTRTDLSTMLAVPTSVSELVLNFLNRYTNTKFEKLLGGRYKRSQ